MKKDMKSLYLMFDFYNPRMYPVGCKTEESDVFITVLDSDSKALAKFMTSDLYQGMNHLQMDNLKKGTYKVDINVLWTDQDIRDYTFRIYAPLEIDIKEVS